MPTFEIDVARRFQVRGREFLLDMAFAANARRLVIFGPSGAGKSLLLHLLAGIHRPDRGRMAIDGHVLCDIAAGLCRPARDRRIGFVFQDYALFPHLSVFDNVAFAMTGAWHGRIRPSHRQRIMDLLATLQVEHLADSRPGQISGGQRQRVAMARALVADPRAIFLDEPLSALDPLLRRAIRSELVQTLEHLDLPAIVITHDPDDVEAFAQGLVVVDNGRVLHNLDYAQARARCPSATELLLGLLQRA